jgi:hypothetical protein
MEAQAGVTPASSLMSTVALRRYWPMGVMTLLMVACWIPYFLPNPKSSSPTNPAFAWAQSRVEIVKDRSFINETVELDNKTFMKCHFENVKLLYHGLGPTECYECSFDGKVYVGSDSLAIRNFIKLDRQFKARMLDDGSVESDSKGNLVPDK